jgi:hypothetical protein
MYDGLATLTKTGSWEDRPIAITGRHGQNMAMAALGSNIEEVVVANIICRHWVETVSNRMSKSTSQAVISKSHKNFLCHQGRSCSFAFHPILMVISIGIESACQCHQGRSFSSVPFPDFGVNSVLVRPSWTLNQHQLFSLLYWAIE